MGKLRAYWALSEGVEWLVRYAILFSDHDETTFTVPWAYDLGVNVTGVYHARFAPGVSGSGVRNTRLMSDIEVEEDYSEL